MATLSVLMASAAQHGLLTRDAADARRALRGAARAVARHHGCDLVATISHGGSAEAVADATALVAACAGGAPEAVLVGRVLAHLRGLLRAGRAATPGHARAERHRSRLADLHALAQRSEALARVLAVAQPTDMQTLTPSDRPLSPSAAA